MGNDAQARATDPCRPGTSNHHASASPRHGRLRGQPVDAAWDPDLGEAIARHAVRVEEEAVLSDLLADLAQAAHAPR